MENTPLHPKTSAKTVTRASFFAHFRLWFGRLIRIVRLLVYGTRAQQNPTQAEMPPTPQALSAALTYCFTDRQGIDYFRFDDPLAMPIRRMVALETASRFLEMNLTRERLSTMLDTMERHANTGNIVALYGVLYELRTRLNLTMEEDTLLQLAACCFIEAGEDPTNPEPERLRQKANRWKADPDAAAFFLNASLQQFGISTTASAADFQHYFSELTPLLTQLSNPNSAPPSPTSSMATTASITPSATATLPTSGS